VLPGVIPGLFLVYAGYGPRSGPLPIPVSLLVDSSCPLILIVIPVYARVWAQGRAFHPPVSLLADSSLSRIPAHLSTLMSERRPRSRVASLLRITRFTVRDTFVRDGK